MNESNESTSYELVDIMNELSEFTKSYFIEGLILSIDNCGNIHSFTFYQRVYLVV